MFSFWRSTKNVCRDQFSVSKLPTVGEDGYIVDEYALIPMCEDVHIGYLNYTGEAVVTLALKLYCSITGMFFICFQLPFDIIAAVND